MAISATRERWIRVVTAVAGPGAETMVRPFESGDRVAVLQLVAADLLPGLTGPTFAELDLAVEGTGLNGPVVRAGLEDVRTEVLALADGQAVGAVSWAVRPSDGAGELLWLHCLEDEQHLARALLERAVTGLGRRTVHAFVEPTTLAPAGLPVRMRPGTRRALEACGFSGLDRWRYLHRRLDDRGGRLYAVADVVECPELPGWRLQLRERDGSRIGEAIVGLPIEGTTTLQWVSLTPARRSMGNILLEQCLAHLADRGVREVTTILPAPVDGRPDLDAALALHTAAGFAEIDQLHIYTRRP
ncbi:GNAT family N-acetyltransferase [Streptomyces sp. SKN60]|uniref:GNAT family N-acetyltransferase n=1 Tax=Streptomyces sp. SKN60 TaxID=2855506 RepID=UPI002246B623|nr:GNAT family N-acetyltransferase [Streptomyces sp. SKN60]MCX2185763.1 GNAT family N-acetyltransferase [Streptomyces sp. SKN60]